MKRTIKKSMNKKVFSLLLGGLMACSTCASAEEQTKLDLLYKGANKLSSNSEKSNETRQAIAEESKQTLMTGLHALADADFLKERIENNQRYVSKFSVAFLEQQLALKEALVAEAETLLSAPECQSAASCGSVREFIAQAKAQVTALKSSITKLSLKE